MSFVVRERKKSKITSGLSTSLTTSYAGTLINTGVTLFNDDSNDYLITHLDSLVIRLTSVSTATSVDIFLSSDSSGDKLLTPIASSVVINPGKTTATKGNVFAKADLILGDVCDTTDEDGLGRVYLWIKTNAGTATLSEVIFCFKQ
jgi:hypothetical protein